MKQKYLTFAKNDKAKRTTESSYKEVVIMMLMIKMLVLIERCIESYCVTRAPLLYFVRS